MKFIFYFFIFISSSCANVVMNTKLDDKFFTLAPPAEEQYKYYQRIESEASSFLWANCEDLVEQALSALKGCVGNRKLYNVRFYMASNIPPILGGGIHYYPTEKAICIKEYGWIFGIYTILYPWASRVKLSALVEEN